MLVAGPPVVARLGQQAPGVPEPDKQALGGWETQTKSGAVDDAVDDEAAAFACARRFLSYLPSSVHELAPVAPADDDPARREPSLMDAIPRDPHKVYHVRRIIEAVVDRGSFFEIGHLFGRSIATGLARLEGRPVALMASDPFHHGGAWT